jgi:hypothetical protein
VLQALQERFAEPMMPPPPDGTGAAVPAAPAEQVTLTAWSGRAELQVLAEGAPLPVQGDTLYRWPLGSVER